MPQSSIRPRVMEKWRNLGLNSNELMSIRYVPRTGKNKGQEYQQFYKGDSFRLFAWLKDVSEEIDGTLYKKDVFGTFWNFVGETKNVNKEGQVEFPNGKKPERLIGRIIEMATEPNNLVLDFFGGSGSTAAATLKSGRRFISIEQMDSQIYLQLKRLNNVMSGSDNSGLSSDVDWHGGGSFVYAELMEKNQGYLKDLLAADTKNKIAKIQNVLTTAINQQFHTTDRHILQELLSQLDTLDKKQAQLVDYQDQLKDVAAVITTYQKIIGDHQPVDLDAKKARVAQLAAIRDELTDRYSKAHDVALFNNDRLKRIKQNDAAIHDQLKQTTELEQLVQTVSGDSDAKLGLERYVLRAELIEILQVANEHLKQLSSGRYFLQLHKEAGTYQKDTGLEIDVYDDNVGQTRSVHTLSGGESFIAALSLALALGEVIQNESGGISIDTLFVDEGFGSLDQESLAMAMGALENIESNSRMIGIISHVTMLQESIPYQIKVQAQGQGKSTTSVIRP